MNIYHLWTFPRHFGSECCWPQTFFRTYRIYKLWWHCNMLNKCFLVVSAGCTCCVFKCRHKVGKIQKITDQFDLQRQLGLNISQWSINALWNILRVFAIYKIISHLGWECLGTKIFHYVKWSQIAMRLGRWFILNPLIADVI